MEARIPVLRGHVCPLRRGQNGCWSALRLTQPTKTEAVWDDAGKRLRLEQRPIIEECHDCSESGYGEPPPNGISGRQTLSDVPTILEWWRWLGLMQRMVEHGSPLGRLLGENNGKREYQDCIAQNNQPENQLWNMAMEQECEEGEECVATQDDLAGFPDLPILPEWADRYPNRATIDHEARSWT